MWCKRISLQSFRFRSELLIKTFTLTVSPTSCDYWFFGIFLFWKTTAKFLTFSKEDKLFSFSWLSNHCYLWLAWKLNDVSGILSEITIDAILLLRFVHFGNNKGVSFIKLTFLPKHCTFVSRNEADEIPFSGGSRISRRGRQSQRGAPTHTFHKISMSKRKNRDP